MNAHNYIQNKQHNAMCFSIAGVDFYFSYHTVVAFRANGRLVVRENDWGPTTGKHLNAIDGGCKDARVGSEEFEKLLAQFRFECIGCSRRRAKGRARHDASGFVVKCIDND